MRSNERPNTSSWSSNFYEARPDAIGDAAALPFQTSSFHTILLFELVQQVPKPTQSLSGVAKVLEPGGRLLLKLGLSGMRLSAVRKNRLAAVLLLPLVVGVLGINLISWLGRAMLPSWQAFTGGYIAVALKP